MASASSTPTHPDSPTTPGSPLGRLDVLCIGVLTAMVTLFWWPALAHQQLVIHGDAAHHGYSLLVLLHDYLHHDGDSLLWDPGIYGGHPLFAEGQGGFLSPVNLLGAALFEPPVGFGVTHWLNMLLGGLGTYALCRSLRIDPWSALFGANILAFSMLYLASQVNYTTAASFAWISWTMAGVQHWLNAPSLRRASLMAIPPSLLLFSGYPHFGHGLLVYFAAFIVAWPLQQAGRQFLKTQFKQIVSGAIAATGLIFLLSAIQLLPLLELIRESYRSEGVTLISNPFLGWTDYIEGLFYFAWPDSQVLDIIGFFCAGVLVMLAAFFHLPRDIFAHLLATLLLWNLGMAHASLVFTLIYDHGLIPGLRGFRIMHPFFAIANVGVALVAAFVLSRLGAAGALGLNRWLPQSGIAEKVACTLLLCAITAGAITLYTPAASSLGLWLGLAGIGALAVLLWSDQRRMIPIVLVALLCTELALLRTGQKLHNFYDASMTDEPANIAAIKALKNHADFRAALLTRGKAFNSYNGTEEELGQAYRGFLSAMSALPTRVAGIPTINASLALPIKRRALIDATVQAEIRGISTTPAGQRMIDRLGVRYLGTRTKAEGFRILFQEGETQALTNRHAVPRLLTYLRADVVGTPEEALDQALQVDASTLVIEGSPGSNVTNREDCTTDNPQSSLVRTHDTARSVQVVVEIECAGWLYLRDAYYPGWSASIDGQSTTLYPANVLGKAIAVPAGRSEVHFFYRPWSFYVGAALSILAWLTLAIYWIGRGRNTP